MSERLSFRMSSFECIHPHPQGLGSKRILPVGSVTMKKLTAHTYTHRGTETERERGTGVKDFSSAHVSVSDRASKINPPQVRPFRHGFAFSQTATPPPPSSSSHTTTIALKPDSVHRRRPCNFLQRHRLASPRLGLGECQEKEKQARHFESE